MRFFRVFIFKAGWWKKKNRFYKIKFFQLTTNLKIQKLKLEDKHFPKMASKNKTKR